MLSKCGTNRCIMKGDIRDRWVAMSVSMASSVDLCSTYLDEVDIKSGPRYGVSGGCINNLRPNL